jgi:putative glutamine amidotransferase
MADERGFGHEEQAIFALNYFEKALAFDMTPIAIPAEDPSHADAYLDLVDGLIFTGGTDIDPEFYGQAPHPKLGTVIRQRDEFELRLARLAIDRGLPVLGVCRGMQVLNVAMGGSLAQHVGPEEGMRRHGTGTPTPEFHEVAVVEDELQSLLGDRPTVNSLHHQGVLELGKGLKVAACSPDGLIEAAVGIGGPLLAVQWHPEQLELGNIAGDAPFRWLRSHMNPRSEASQRAS